MEIKLDVNKHIYRYLQELADNEDISLRALQGARRSGKTYTTCQFLLIQALQFGDTIIVASMTAEQGRAGAYEDMKTILREAPKSFSQYFEIYKTPREIRCKATTESGKQGTIVFRSFLDPETAKGGACDYVFINEANKFSKQQYLDLSVNARKGVILDYNPQQRFWADDYDIDILRCSWWQNRKHLTRAQIKWFEDIRDAAHRQNATAADIYYYQVYYRGEYCGLSGQIFTRANIHTIKEADVPKRLHSPIIFTDPSALRGNDFFPIVLCAVDDARNLYVLRTDSRNDGTKSERLQKIVEFATLYDNTRIYIETNGLVGIEFAEFVHASGVQFVPYTSTKKKFDRIVAHYQELTQRVFFVDNYNTGEFLQQVFEFSEKCEHDDNIDCVNSAVMVEKILGQF